MHRSALLLVCFAVYACASPSKQFVAIGDVVAIDAPDHVTIRHDAIAGFGPAATTRFAADAVALQSAVVGQRVRVVLREQRTRVVATSITLLEMGNPGVHDHTPHHGGVVAMLGMTHVEARAEVNGHIRVYLTDRFRRPLELSDVDGTVTLWLAGGKQTLPLAVVGDALDASGPPLSGSEIHSEVRLVHAGQPLEMTFQLPLASASGGAAGIPAGGCVQPTASSDNGPAPRCILAFRRPIAVLAATPDGTRFIVAAADVGVSVWRVRSAELVLGLQPAPAVVLSAPEVPHVEVANAVSVHPDGRRAVVALENRLLIHDLESGRIVSARTHPHGIVRAVVWSPPADALLVTSFYDSSARLIAVEDGLERRAFAVDREGAAVAFAEDGRTIAVGSELGSIAIFDVTTGARTRTLSEPRAATRGLAFVGARLVGVSDDGVLRVWNLDRHGPGLVIAAETGSQLVREPGGSRIASAGRDGVLRVYDVAHQNMVVELRWHSTPLSALAWAGTTIVSGDGDGHVALWDAPPPHSLPR